MKNTHKIQMNDGCYMKLEHIYQMKIDVIILLMCLNVFKRGGHENLHIEASFFKIL